MHNQCTLTWYGRLWQAWEEYVDSLIEDGVTKPNLAHWIVCYLVRLALFFLRVVEPVIRFRVWGDIEVWEAVLVALLAPPVMFLLSVVAAILGA